MCCLQVSGQRDGTRLLVTLESKQTDRLDIALEQFQSMLEPGGSVPCMFYRCSLEYTVCLIVGCVFESYTKDVCLTVLWVQAARVEVMIAGVLYVRAAS